MSCVKLVICVLFVELSLLACRLAVSHATTLTYATGNLTHTTLGMYLTDITFIVDSGADYGGVSLSKMAMCVKVFDDLIELWDRLRGYESLLPQCVSPEGVALVTAWFDQTYSADVEGEDKRYMLSLKLEPRGFVFA